MEENTLHIYRRWLTAGLSAFVLHMAFLFLFLRIEQEVKLKPAPFLELDYITLPAPPRIKPKKKRVPKPPPKVVKKRELPKPPPVAKAPVAVSEPSPAIPDIVSAPAPAKAPEIVENVQQLDNVEFTPFYNPKPAYPRIARAAGIEGHVIVELLIDEEGRVKTFSIRKTVGHQQFALSTAKVIKRWRFPPPRIHGKPAKVRYQYSVIFKLE
jgi:protein TonB